MADTEYGQLLKIEQSGGLNPSQQSRKQALESSGQTALSTDGGSSSSPSGLNTTDVLKNAQSINQFYQQANQPVIQSYEASKAPLQQRYSDLLSSIKQNQTTAENRQTVTTQNELGRRGIFTDSGIGAQELTNALNPITQQYTQLGKDTTNQENIDLANIQNAIAQLQAGNPSAAVSTSTGLASAQQQANQFAQTLAEQQKQNAVENALKQLMQEQNYAQQQAQLDISRQNTGIAGGHLALDQAQFELQKNLQDPAYLQGLMEKLGINNPAISLNQPGLSQFIK